MLASSRVSPSLGGARHWWRTLRVAYWLGWQIESNWTDPFLFFVYSIARPLGSVLILVFMYYVVGRAGAAGLLGFFVVGTACWPFVVQGMMGTAWSLISDREHWKTLRYVYTSPIPFRAYLIGRALAQSTTAVSAAAVTLVVGRWVLGAPLHVATIHFPYTLLPFALGIASVLALGLMVVSAAILISTEPCRLPDGVRAALSREAGRSAKKRGVARCPGVTLLGVACSDIVSLLCGAWAGCTEQGHNRSH